MPTDGIDLDPRTAALIDSDGDGRIRPGEVLAAVDWICSSLEDPGEILSPGDSVRLTSIKDSSLAASARSLLDNLGRGGAAAVSLSDVTDRGRAFAETLFNGDGVVPPEAAEDEGTRRAMADIMEVMGGAPDRSGASGLDLARLEAFYDQARAYADWAARPAREPALVPLGPEGTTAAAEAVAAVRAKIEDYFARCRLAALIKRARRVRPGRALCDRNIALFQGARDWSFVLISEKLRPLAVQ